LPCWPPTLLPGQGAVTEIDAVAALSLAGLRIAGQVAGYTAADYLIQHAIRERRYARVPASTCDAVLTPIRDPADPVRLAVSKRERRRTVAAELKTPRSRRALEMPAMAAAVLALLRRAQPVERLKAGGDWEDHDLAFAGPYGRPLWPHDISRGLKALCERAGLGRDWQPRGGAGPRQSRSSSTVV
jgi:hypothetical protein